MAIVRAILAVLALVAITVGVPMILVALGDVLPVDLSALSSQGLARPDDGGLVLLLLLALAWGAWAVMVASVSVEVWAALRRVPSPRLPGLTAPQRLAAALVALVAVTLLPATGSTAAPVDRRTGPAGSLSLLVSSAVTAPVDLPDVTTMRPESTALFGQASTPPSLPQITTARHDTLWSLAEHHLGSGERFSEIAALNEGVPQPDGRTLGRDGRLYPGWVLTLPGDATVQAPAAQHVVEPGDTLWGIAEEELGDGTRYPEIFRANEGDRQPDGRRLRDPDLILPGWSLEIPEREEQATTSGSDEAATAGPMDTAEEGAPEPRDSEPSATEPPALDRGRGAAASSERPGGRALVDGHADAEATEPSAPSIAPFDDPAATIDRAAVLPDSAIPMPAGGVLGVFLLAGVAGELARRRRQFQRHRRPGERMPTPGEGAREVENAARAAAGEPAPDLLERALGQLATSCRSSGIGAPPVRLVRVARESVTLHFAQASPHALAPFRARDERVWELDRALLQAATDEAEVRGLPGLVTLGMQDDETLVLNLAEVGTLQIDGAPEALPGVVRALASELALGPAGGDTARTLALSDHALSEAIRSAMEAGDLAVESDQRRVARTLAAAVRRGPQDPWLGDPLELVLTDRPLPLTVPGRSGAALITTDPDAQAGARMTLAVDGTARLDPEGVTFVAQTLAAGASDRLVELMRSTELPVTLDTPLWAAPPPAPGRAPSDTGAVGPQFGAGERVARAQPVRGDGASPRRTPVLASVGDPPATPATRPIPAAAAPTRPVPAAAAPHEGSAAPRLLLLGEVLVENAHGKAESTRIGRLAETAAFVLLNPGARPSELQTALWPGRRPNPQTCRQMISRTRTWLGRTDAGDSYLMQLAEADGRLRLRDEVGSDWADFQRLVAAGMADPDDTATLSEALRLVRGRPFGSIAARELPWADLFVNEMICQITDVAHELAVRYERAGQWSAAREAALRGLRTECESEILEAVVARLGRSA